MNHTTHPDECPYPVVCLCGSTKFKTEYEAAFLAEVRAKHIVLTSPIFSHADGDELDDSTINDLTLMHEQKIRMCDEVLVINVGGYIGNATAREIQYAASFRKPVRYLEPLVP